ncbi:hypothetical protein MRB53_005541 [Persea americana]|uniref:Uncharacterized protein n=1 Tax=Persea americana TaxID=3435 RepID=A0ACC2MDW2_PERAE|nr:hypothetical protein MRB53_005541 [Persea americana]
MRLMYVDVKEKNILGPFKVRSKCGVVSEVSIQSIVFQQDPHERFILPRQEAAVQNVTPRAKQMAVRLLMQVRVLFLGWFSNAGCEMVEKDIRCNGSIAQCHEEEELFMESEISRRFLAGTDKYITYPVLGPDKTGAGVGYKGDLANELIMVVVERKRQSRRGGSWSLGGDCRVDRGAAVWNEDREGLLPVGRGGWGETARGSPEEDSFPNASSLTAGWRLPFLIS